MGGIEPPRFSGLSRQFLAARTQRLARQPMTPLHPHPTRDRPHSQHVFLTLHQGHSHRKRIGSNGRPQCWHPSDPFTPVPRRQLSGTSSPALASSPGLVSTLAASCLRIEHTAPRGAGSLSWWFHQRCATPLLGRVRSCHVHCFAGGCRSCIPRSCRSKSG